MATRRKVFLLHNGGLTRCFRSDRKGRKKIYTQDPFGAGIWRLLAPAFFAGIAYACFSGLAARPTPQAVEQKRWEQRGAGPMAVAVAKTPVPADGEALLALRNMLDTRKAAVVQIQLIPDNRPVFGTEQLENYFLPENLLVQHGDPVNEREVGSGFVVRPDGYIVTARHLLTNMDVVEVILNNGARLMAEVVGSDLRSNVAVLKIDRDNLPALPLEPGIPIRPGHLVFAIGSPMGADFRNSVSQGILSARDAGEVGAGLPAFQASYWLVDAAMNPGNSGGPVLDVQGRLVGMANVPFTEHRSAAGLRTIIPAGRVINSVNNIIAREREGQARLGIRYGPVSTSLVHRGGAAEIVEVAPGSSAFEAGLRAGDIILAINGARLENPLALSEEIEQKSPGDVITLTIQRGGDAIHMQIRLQSKAPVRKKETASPRDEMMAGLGMVVDDLTQALMYDLEVPVAAGAVILFVDPTSAAYREGDMRSGLVIVEAAGNPVGSKEDLYRIYRQTRPGERLMLKFYRPHTMAPVLGAVRR